MHRINASRRKFVIGSGIVVTSTALGLTLRSTQTHADSAAARVLSPRQLA